MITIIIPKWAFWTLIGFFFIVNYVNIREGALLFLTHIGLLK